MKNIYLIVGPSGVGKTTLVERLAKEHGLKQVESYTTRQPRYPGETSHIFVSDEEFDALGEMVAYTEYNGFRYGVTSDIIDSHDLYVIDPFGVDYMLARYRGCKGVVVIWLVAEPDEIRRRMRARGDTDEMIAKRLAVDAQAFDLSKTNFEIDLMIHADGIQETANAVWEYIRFREKSDPCVRIYQISWEHDVNRLNFADSQYLGKHCCAGTGRAKIDFSLYDEVWSGDIPVSSLDDLYLMFNRDDRPNANNMRSMSVSDIVEISHNLDSELNGKWFCDSFGWKKIREEDNTIEATTDN